MKRLAVLVAGISLLALTLASPAEARFFGVKCSYNQDAQVDPIAQPGVKPSDHLHEFFCAKGVTQNSTTATLEAGTTSATAGFFQPDSGGQVAMPASHVADATTGVWLPAMYLSGVLKHYSWITEYWSNTSIGHRAFVDIPEGSQMVAGDHSATTPQPEYVVFWNCGGDFTATYPDSTTPNNCPSNHTLQIHFEFPVCWDGSGTARTDFLNPTSPPFTETAQFKACPTGYKQLPHLQVIAHTGLHGDVTRTLSFSCGVSWKCVHADYWQSWKDQSVIQGGEQFLRTGVLP